MAEAWANALYPLSLKAQSAGLEPGTINPYVIRAMAEVNIDISKSSPTPLVNVIMTKSIFNYVITVCDESSSGKCPVFPSSSTKLHWNFPDPSKFIGNEEQVMKDVRKIRDSIKDKVSEFGKKIMYKK
ncbi:MAG: Arsenate reductase [Candidatus Moanabacter tarae]|uniref:Arsenate reductase n=1 Tax=Candidatus Moanibacter tarae TaxID=2200854 RepID=A0A2Z4AF55_9BACT|nr:MAG: Arsenate reductase [Candidatus Moanabacter tarae]|tara:strand:+ start:3438 stop:3821 length:384 start_codon:yes stop_codon:yes gene_type:complete